MYKIYRNDCFVKGMHVYGLALISQLCFADLAKKDDIW